MKAVSLLLVALCAACGDAPFTASDVRAPVSEAGEDSPTMGDDASPSPEASSPREAGDPSSEGGDAYPVTPPDSGAEASAEAGMPEAASDASEAGLPSQCCIACIYNYTQCSRTCVNTNDDASNSCYLCGPAYQSCDTGCGGTCPSNP